MRLQQFGAATTGREVWSYSNESAVVQTAAMECSSAEQQQWAEVVWSSNNEAEVVQHGSNKAAVG